MICSEKSRYRTQHFSGRDWMWCGIQLKKNKYGYNTHCIELFWLIVRYYAHTYIFAIPCYRAKFHTHIWNIYPHNMDKVLHLCRLVITNFHTDEMFLFYFGVLPVQSDCENVVVEWMVKTRLPYTRLSTPSKLMSRESNGHWHHWILWF